MFLVESLQITIECDAFSVTGKQAGSQALTSYFQLEEMDSSVLSLYDLPILYSDRSILPQMIIK